MRVAFTDLTLDALYVVCSVERRYRLAERVEAVPPSAVVANAGPHSGSRAMAGQAHMPLNRPV